MRDWLKDKRLKREMTQRKVAEKAGITQQFYSLIEFGSNGLSVEVAKRIAEVLGFDWTRFYE